MLGQRGRVGHRALEVIALPADRREGTALRVVNTDLAVEQPGHRGGHLRQVAAAQHQVGEPVVRLLGALYRGGVLLNDGVGAREVGDGLRCVDAERGVRSQ